MARVAKESCFATAPCFYSSITMDGNRFAPGAAKGFFFWLPLFSRLGSNFPTNANIIKAITAVVAVFSVCMLNLFYILNV